MYCVGIMGGTFDPIHYGHLVTAEGVRYEYGLQKVIFVPAGRPPHKLNYKITDPRHRYNMTRLAVSSNRFFDILPLEIERPGPSYSIDTVRDISRLYPAAKIFFITGADAVMEILTWKDVEQLLAICNFIAATRPGYRLDGLREVLERLPPVSRENIFTIEVPALAISSTDIRQRVREGKPIKYLIPEPVEDYIEKNRLYRD